MTWLDKYELLTQEYLNTKDMQAILGWSDYSKVKEFRIKLVAKLKSEGIKLDDNMKIPTELFLKARNKDMSYYEKKMKEEHELRKIKEEING